MPTSTRRHARYGCIIWNTNKDADGNHGWFHGAGGFMDEDFAGDLYGIREGRTGPYQPWSGGPVASGQTPNFTAWDAQNQQGWWLRNGGRLLFQVNGSMAAPYTASPAADGNVWSAAKPDNCKYAHAAVADHLPNGHGRRGLWGWLGPNEGDLNQVKVVYPISKATAIARHFELEQARYQALRVDRKHPGVLFSMTTSGEGLRRDLGSTFRIHEWLAYQSGKLFDFVDALATSWHHQTSDFRDGILTAAPAQSKNSMYWAWTAINEARAAYQTAYGTPAPLVPICITEYGISSKMNHYGGAASGDWATDDDTLNGKMTARAYRAGAHLAGMFYWAAPMVSVYSLGFSDADRGAGATELIQGRGSANGTMNFWHVTTNDFGAHEPFTSQLVEFFRLKNYLLPSDGVIPIVAKGWRLNPVDLNEGFHNPKTWLVHASMFGLPVSASLAAIPWTEWSRVTFTAGNIACAAGGINLIGRPVVLPLRTRYRVSCEINATGSAIAKICVRGYDYLNGLALTQGNAVTANGTWQSSSATFRCRGHAVPGLSNAPRCHLLLFHNGAGTAQFRNVRIEPV